MAEDFKFRGYTLEELKKMSLLDFANIAGSRAKRHLKRNHSDAFYERIEKDKKSKQENKNTQKRHHNYTKDGW